MNNEVIINALKSIKPGCLFRITYKSELPVKAEFKKNGYRLVKITEATVRTGVDYSNIQSVIEKRENASEDGAVAKQRENNFEWIIRDRVSYNSNTNKFYARVATLRNGGANIHSKFILVDSMSETYELEKLSESQKDIVQNSYWNRASAPEVQNISFENIISIGKVVVK